jgi:hypothetical protein
VSKQVTVADLPNLSDYPKLRILLYCDKCGAEYSANRGDYWYLVAQHVLTCVCESEDPQPLQLVVKTIVMRPFKRTPAIRRGATRSKRSKS